MKRLHQCPLSRTIQYHDVEVVKEERFHAVCQMTCLKKERGECDCAGEHTFEAFLGKMDLECAGYVFGE